MSVDNIWASPSALHLRVHVMADDCRWRHKYEVTVPVSDIPEEAIASLWVAFESELIVDDVELDQKLW